MTQNPWHGTEAKLINRLMWHSHAKGIAAFLGAGTSVTSLLIYREVPLNAQQILLAIENEFLMIGFCALVFATGGWWTVSGWRRLWRRGRSYYERLLYDYGVRTFGVITAVGLLITVTWLGWKSDAGTFPGPLMTGGALAALFFGVPISLHLGYFWGHTFATVMGVEPDLLHEKGEPPQVQ